MHKLTKLLQFSQSTKSEIADRDQNCIFCKLGYHMGDPLLNDLSTIDAMHVVNKSHLGLGIVQNGVLGCRYHHSLMDNGNKGLDKEMRAIAENYLIDLYPEWTKEMVIYHKWSNFKY